MKKKILWSLAGLVGVLLLIFIAGNINAPSTNSLAKEHAEAALKYCKANGLRTDYCILVDFSVHPGKNRFFVWTSINRKLYIQRFVSMVEEVIVLT